jgi:hypothetical protein
VAHKPEIIDGPTAVVTSRDCDTFRWRVRHARGEQSVYVEIAWALQPEVLEEPLRAAVESRGEAPLRELFAYDEIPVRIRITAAGIFIVDADGEELPIWALRWRGARAESDGSAAAGPPPHDVHADEQRED